MLNNFFKGKTATKSATSFWANDYDLDYGWDDGDVGFACLSALR